MSEIAESRRGLGILGSRGRRKLLGELLFEIAMMRRVLYHHRRATQRTVRNENWGWGRGYSTRDCGRQYDEIEEVRLSVTEFWCPEFDAILIRRILFYETLVIE